MPLNRKVNTKARGVDHRFGGDFKHDRNSKKESRGQIFGSMHGKNNRGLDEGLLQRVNPNVKTADLTSHCRCFTPTINGILYEDWDQREIK